MDLMTFILNIGNKIVVIEVAMIICTSYQARIELAGHQEFPRWAASCISFSFEKHYNNNNYYY